MISTEHEEEKDNNESTQPVLKTPSVQKEYQKLKALSALQKQLVKKNMHKAMSPISAISGYLELMKIFLEEGVEKEKLEQYRSKIEEGISEISEIVESLHEIFDKENETDLQEQLVSAIGSQKTQSSKAKN